MLRIWLLFFAFITPVFCLEINDSEMFREMAHQFLKRFSVDDMRQINKDTLDDIAALNKDCEIAKKVRRVATEVILEREPAFSVYSDLSSKAEDCFDGVILDSIERYRELRLSFVSAVIKMLEERDVVCSQEEQDLNRLFAYLVRRKASIVTENMEFKLLEKRRALLRDE